MRVLHVDPERGWGGGEVQVAGLIRTLAGRGVQNLLAAPAGAPLAQAVTPHAEIVDCRIANDLDVRCVPRLRALAHAVDVVHFHTARAHAMAPWLWGTAARRVVTRRMDYVPRGGRWLAWRYNHAVDRVIAISDGVRRAMVAGGVDHDRVRVVPSGVDVAAFSSLPDDRARIRREWGVGDDAVVVLVLGALEQRKGHHVLLDAAGRLGSGQAPVLVFVGSGSAEQALRSRAASVAVSVCFAGFRTDVAACLAGSDVVAVPSLHEGLGVAALEAMAAGRPVIASAVGGLAEVVVDQVTGLLVPPKDPVRLAGALATLVGDPARRRAYGEAGATRVAERYSLRAMAEGTLACYLDPA
jgi:glycosyltransferase involved in cell wall biosynthesis